MPEGELNYADALAVRDTMERFVENKLQPYTAAQNGAISKYFEAIQKPDVTPSGLVVATNAFISDPAFQHDRGMKDVIRPSQYGDKTDLQAQFDALPPEGQKAFLASFNNCDQLDELGKLKDDMAAHNNISSAGMSATGEFAETYLGLRGSQALEKAIVKTAEFINGDWLLQPRP